MLRHTIWYGLDTEEAKQIEERGRARERSADNRAFGEVFGVFGNKIRYLLVLLTKLKERVLSSRSFRSSLAFASIHSQRIIRFVQKIS